MIQDLAEALNLDRDNELIFQGIEILAPKKKGTVPKTKELDAKISTTEGGGPSENEEVLRAKWQSLGISGSAVVPKVAESPEWAECLEGVSARS